MSRIAPRFALLALLLLLTALPAPAHNGAVAIAVPVEGITVDGDLSDWPADMASYDVELLGWGDAVDDENDFHGGFRVGYDRSEGALYVAVEAQDESIVIGNTATWNAQDGCEVYVDTVHDGRSGPRMYAVFGNTSRSGTGVVGTTREANRLRYEWRMDIGEARAGVLLGLGVTVHDKDEDGSFSTMTWGMGTNKVPSPYQLGDVALAEQGLSMGTIQGRATWEGSENGIPNAEVWIQSLQQARYKWCVKTDGNGFYSAHLPQGTYRLEVAFDSEGDGKAPTELPGGSVVTASLVAQRPTLEGASRHFLECQFDRARSALELLIAATPSRAERSEARWMLGWCHAFLGDSERTEEVFRELVRDNPDFRWLEVQGPGFASCHLGHREYRDVSREVTFRYARAHAIIGLEQAPARAAQQRRERTALVVAVALLLIVAGYVVKRTRERNRARNERDAARREMIESLAEKNRQLEQSSRFKSDFLARMSHDLRTPMNAIIGYSRILLRRTKDVLEERQYRNLENIETSANNLLILINEILDLSRIEAGRIDLKPEPVDLGKLIGECITSVAPLTKPGVELGQDLEEVPTVTTDADRIRRVVMNLLGNAVKFTEEGSITVSLKAADPGVELAVADTGVGIPADDLPHIFEEFRQVERQVGEKTEGTGLGLAIAKKSVEMLGGTVSAESEVGKGATFTVRIGDYEV